MVAPEPAGGASVSLRRGEPADATMLQGWRAESAVRRYQPILQLSVDALAKSLAERAALTIGPEMQGEVLWIVEAATVPVGWITLRVLYRAHGVAELGYSLATAYHGRGLMPAALPLVLTIAFDPTVGLDLYRIEARAAVANRASRRVLARTGFVREGTARRSPIINGERVDHALYALLRDEWRAVPSLSP